jgi:predicted transcriptional regulator
MESEGGDVKNHFKITDKGKELLRHLAEVQTDDGK